jgi:hypothetical protein
VTPVAIGCSVSDAPDLFSVDIPNPGHVTVVLSFFGLI